MIRESSKMNSDVLERIGSIESTIRHLEVKMKEKAQEDQQNYAALQKAIEKNKQPITAYAGLASVVLMLVFAYGAPLKDADSQLREDILRLRNQQDLLYQRELQDSFYRGVNEQTFETVKSQISSGINNRKDIDKKHVAAQHDLSRQISQNYRETQREIEQIKKLINNGISRNVSENTNDIKWLKTK